jgi:hypothetical protein
LGGNQANNDQHFPGKTLLAKTLAKFVNVPFVIADATTLTQVCLPIFVITHYLQVPQTISN